MIDNVWEFGSGPNAQRVSVKGNRIVNDGSLIRDWAIAGHGVVLKSELDVGDDVRSGMSIGIEH